jgi:hypothetical protein
MIRAKTSSIFFIIPIYDRINFAGPENKNVTETIIIKFKFASAGIEKN